MRHISLLKRVVPLVLIIAACGGQANQSPPPSNRTGPLDPDPGVTGTWFGTLPFGKLGCTMDDNGYDAVTNPNVCHGPSDDDAWRFTFQLKQRADTDNNVIGYVVGGTEKRVILAKNAAGTTTSHFDADTSTLTLVLEFGDGGSPTEYTLEGTVSGDDFTGTISPAPFSCAGSSNDLVTLTRIPNVLEERRFVFAVLDPMTGSPSWLMRVEAAYDASLDRLVSGSWVTMMGTNPLGNSGQLTGYSETTEHNVRLDLSTSGVNGLCPQQTTLYADFDPDTRFYTVTGYSPSAALSADCGCTATASTVAGMLGLKGPKARTDHGDAVLTAFAQYADDLEANAGAHGAYSNPYSPPFLSSYLHNGDTTAQRVAELNLESSTHSAILVEFERFRSLKTMDDPLVSIDTESGFGDLAAGKYYLSFTDRRTDTGTATVYREYDTAEPVDPTHLYVRNLQYVGPGSSGWGFLGNQADESALADLPVSQESFYSDTYASGAMWPFGLHGGGHQEGHPGIDFFVDTATLVRAVHGGTALAIVGLIGGVPDPHNICIKEVTELYTSQTCNISQVLVPGMYTTDPSSTEPVPVTRGQPLAMAETHPFTGGNVDGMAAESATHWGMSVSGAGEVCPFFYLTIENQAILLNLFGMAAYGQQLTEPFLCNDINAGRIGNSCDLSHPFERTWTLKGSGTNLHSPTNPGGNPHHFVVRRHCDWPNSTHNYDYDYEFYDAGATTPYDSGTASYGGVDPKNTYRGITFHSTVTSGLTRHTYLSLKPPVVLDGSDQATLVNAMKDITLTLDLTGGPFWSNYDTYSTPYP